MSNYSGWSDWIWSEDRTQAYRARQDETGRYVYEYHNPNDPTAPRDHDVADALGDLNLHSEEAHYGGYGSYAPGVAAGSGQHLDQDHYSTSPAQTQPQPPSKSKGKNVDKGGKTADKGGKSSKKPHQGSKQPPPSSSSSKSKHHQKGSKGSSRAEQRDDYQYEGENDPRQFSDPFYKYDEAAADLPAHNYAQRVESMTVPEEEYPQREPEEEFPPEDSGPEPEPGHSGSSKRRGRQDDYQPPATYPPTASSTAYPPTTYPPTTYPPTTYPPTTYPPTGYPPADYETGSPPTGHPRSGYPSAAERGYERGEGEHRSHRDNTASKHSKHGKAAGKRKKEHHPTDHSFAESEAYPEESNQALQDAIEEASGYSTGDATSSGVSFPTAIPFTETYPEDDDSEDGEVTPTRARSTVDDDENYPEFSDAQAASYPGQGGYATGQATSYTAAHGGRFATSRDADYMRSHDSGVAQGRDTAYTHSHDSGVAQGHDTVYPQTQSNSYHHARSYVSGHGGSYFTSGQAVMDVKPSSTGEQLDNRYVIEDSRKFAPGEVFKVLWPEPLGSGRNTETPTEIEEHNDHLGQKIFVGFRRFIVVANDEGHCTCVPILTYERRGCTKKGLKPQKHGIVYPEGGQPVMLKDEPQLGYPPVQLQLDLPTEKLAPQSRVNYSKLVTVEHNIKVFFIGRIVREDFDIVNQAVDECWWAKHRKAGESSRKGGSSRKTGESSRKNHRK